jgi:mRNA interferase RelE/StbE
VNAALQVWSHTYCRALDQLPIEVQQAVQRKVDEIGARLDTFPHRRLSGRPEYRLRVGDYRVLYEFDAGAGRLYLHFVGHRREIYEKT